MSCNINEIKQRVEVLVAKDQKTTYLNANKFNKYAPIALDKIIVEQRRKFEGGLSTDNMSELKYFVELDVDPTTGILLKPSDYVYFDTMSRNVVYKNRRGESTFTVSPIELLSDNELQVRRGSMVSPPTKEYPIVLEANVAFVFYPHNIGRVIMSYIRKPLIPFWNYTIVSGEQTYAPTGGVLTNPNAGVTAGNSSDFELPYQFKDDLIMEICSLFGVTVRQADILQAAQALNPKP